ncbi:PREDICTED: endoplasmic reticulum-Golgi intermediate compartment protein 3 [Nicrophorus vespilloides]|uniref:Endoplasmic reticulum-Golgi intermediate compartment protein 3 n=1 Tax=Nicrophorus vespilloides TaxID=110193 RepID=A0ABM1ND40_NICVS|nr:PREDICTED: endoplasmic reticulum-Golgi intermediate compartment protein 3 [Nicrophorus vespilloides]
MSVFEKLRRFDAYSKTMDDFRIRTYGGAAITIISIIIMGLLFWVELVDFVTPNLSEELFVDTTRSPNININLDVIIPTISCDFLALDAMDSSGEQHLEIDHNIYKRRLDLEGNPIEEPQKEDITIQTKEVTEGTNSTEILCGSCYGASMDPKRCCNTCDEVREAYREMRWALDNLENITQCKDEKYNERLKTAFSQGCQIYGSLTVNRVSGSFHIAPGKSFSINHMHVHDVQPFSSTVFNTTHTIKHLSFGAKLDGDAHNPLKDTYSVAHEGATMFQYHIKIVPTSYVNIRGEIINTNQFSVTKHQKVISVLSGESGMPGAFFQYELSPLMVKFTEKERSFGHFITNLCAIIGGIYTVASLIDAMVYRSVQLIQKKIELGKLN